MNQMNGPRLFDGPGFGRLSPNRFRNMMDARGPEYSADYFEYTVESGAVAANATVILTLNIERNSAFEWLTLKGGGTAAGQTLISANAGFLVTISDSASGRNLMNAPTPLANLCGGQAPNTGFQFPFVLPIARRFMPATQVSIALTEIMGQAWDNVELTFGGRKLWMDGRPGAGGVPLQRFNLWQAGDGRVLCEDLFFFTFDTVGTIPTGAAPGLPITQVMQADGDFEWILTQAVSSANTPDFGASGQDGTFVQVDDAGAGRRLFSQPTSAQSISGFCGTPYVLPLPRIILAKSSITVTFSLPLPGNAAPISRTWFTMVGRKLFEQD